MEFPFNLSSKLTEKANQNALRTLKTSSLCDFSSNDFYGLAQNTEIKTRLLTEIEKQTYIGSGGSRLLSGNKKTHEELEIYLSQFFKSETTLLFSSGYLANIGLLSCIAQRNDLIIYDELAHSSIKDGARLALAQKVSFKHNNSADLDKKLSLKAENTFVVVESIYSMDGDFCKINELLEVCNRHKAYLIVDEAHSTGIYGNGAGLITEKGLENQVFARTMTFGKAVGASGACICGSEQLKSFLINFARSFIYTTAPTLVQTQHIFEALQYIEHNNLHLKSELEMRIKWFKEIIPTDSETAIQPIIIGDIQKLKNLVQNLENEGFDARAILSPTVPEGTERLRICLHTFNTKEEVCTLAESIKKHL